MKKLLIAMGVGLLSGSLWAACMGPFCYDDTGASIAGKPFNGNGVGLPVVSSTTLVTLPNYIGQTVVCNTCGTANGSTSAYELCFSTTATAGYFVVASSTTKRCL